VPPGLFADAGEDASAAVDLSGYGIGGGHDLLGGGQFRLGLLEGVDEGSELGLTVAEDPLAAIVEAPAVVLLIPCPRGLVLALDGHGTRVVVEFVGVSTQAKSKRSDRVARTQSPNPVSDTRTLLTRDFSLPTGRGEGTWCGISSKTRRPRIRWASTQVRTAVRFSARTRTVRAMGRSTRSIAPVHRA